MKVNKKSQEIGRNAIFWIILLAIFFIAMAVYIYQSGDRAMYYISKIFRIG